MQTPLGNISYYDESAPRSSEEYHARVNQDRQQQSQPFQPQTQTPSSAQTQQAQPQPTQLINNYFNPPNRHKNRIFDTMSKMTTVRQAEKFVADALGGFSDMYKTANYLKPLKMDDKYKRGASSFSGAIHGLGGAVVTAAMGAGKEGFDLLKKNFEQQTGLRDYGGHKKYLEIL